MKDNNEDKIQLNEIFGEVVKLVLKNLIPLMHIPLKKKNSEKVLSFIFEQTHSP